MKHKIDDISHEQRAANVEAARKAAHAAHAQAHERALKLRTDADDERAATLKAIDKAAADAYEARRSSLAREVYATLRPLCAAYVGDVRGATAEALRVGWNALSARARNELGSPLRIEVLTYALFPTLRLSSAHAVDVLGDLGRATPHAQAFADALRAVVVFSERGSAIVTHEPVPEDERNALTSFDLRALEQRRASERVAKAREAAASVKAPPMPSIHKATRLLIG